MYKTTVKFSKLINVIEEIIDSIDPVVFNGERWFREKSRQIEQIELIDYLLLKQTGSMLVIPVIVSFVSQAQIDNGVINDCNYYIPLLICREKPSGQIWLEIEHAAYRAYLFDGIHSLEYNQALKEMVINKGNIRMEKGLLKAEMMSGTGVKQTAPLTEHSSNSLTIINEKQIIKTYRCLSKGVNPDLEIALSLTKETSFDSFPALNGYLNYLSDAGEEYSLALIEEYVENEGDLWAYTQSFLQGYQHFFKQKCRGAAITQAGITDQLLEYIEDYSWIIKKLGQKIANLHLALASIKQENFIPENISRAILENWVDTVMENTAQFFAQLKRYRVEGERDKLLNRVISLEDFLYQQVGQLVNYQDKLGLAIRVHGDLHLEQLLKQKDDFMILDFEGEPLRASKYRRLKQLPLKDIAGMVRSFNYAAYSILLEKATAVTNSLPDYLLIWEKKVVETFLGAYTNTVREQRLELLPPENCFNQILTFFKLEKALYEGIYELNNRPDWLVIPLQGIIESSRELVKLQ